MLTLVTGTGYTGGRVLKQLPDAVGLSRSARSSQKRTVAFDLDRDTVLPTEVVERLSDQYRIVYTVPPRGDAHDERLARFLRALTVAPQRFVYISTTGVYGDCGGDLVDERRAANPQTDRARRRRAAEQQLESWAAANNCDLVILRVPGIYGPGRLGEDRLRGGAAVLAEADANPGNRIHVDDLTDCCVAALDAPAGIYNVGDGDTRSSSWFQRELARQLGLDEPPQINRAEAERTYSRQRLSFLSESRRIDTRKMHDVLGVTPNYPSAEQGIAASLAKK